MKKAIPVLKSVWFLLIIALVFMGVELPFPVLVVLTALAMLAPILRELWIKADLDERQTLISHYSSHIAYFTYTGLLIFTIIREWTKSGAIPSPLLFVLLGVPLLAKIAICLFQNYGGVSGGIAGFFNLFFRGLLPSRKIDERQSVIGNLSSHVAFYLFLALTLGVVLYHIRLGGQPSSQWQMLLYVPLISKLYTSLLDTYGFVKGAKAVAYILAGLFFLFVLLSHGVSLGALFEAAPFLLVAVAAVFISRFPQIAGLVFLLVAVGMLILMGGWMKFEVYTRILMWALIPVPFIICGLGLIVSTRSKPVQ